MFVDDVVQANKKAMESDVQGVFNIASGSATSISDLAGMLMGLFNFRESPVFQPERKGETRHSVAAIGEAGKAFGYVPDFSLEAGLRMMTGDTDRPRKVSR